MAMPEEEKKVEDPKPEEKKKDVEKQAVETKYYSPQITVGEIVERIKGYPNYIRDMNIKKGVPADDPQIAMFTEFLEYMVKTVADKIVEKNEDLLTKFLNDGFGVFPEFCDPDNIYTLFRKYNQIGFGLQYVDPTLLGIYVHREIIPVSVADYMLIHFIIGKTMIVLYDYVVDPPQEEANKSRLIVGA